MTDLAEILILAVVQGITEFLPISSTGHLVLIGGWMEQSTSTGMEKKLTVDVVLHLGTLLAGNGRAKGVLPHFW